MEIFFIITRSPEQYIDDMNMEDFRGISENDGSIILFDDMLEYKHNVFDSFLTRRRHTDLDVYHSSQSFSELPKRTIKNKSNRIFFFIQTLKYFEKIYKGFAGFDMSFDDFKELCREAW